MVQLSDFPDLSFKRLTPHLWTPPVGTAIKENIFKTTGQQIIWLYKLRVVLGSNHTFPADSLEIDGVRFLINGQPGNLTYFLNSPMSWGTGEASWTQNGQEPLQIRRSLDLYISTTVAAQQVQADAIVIVADDSENEFQGLASPPNIT